MQLDLIVRGLTNFAMTMSFLLAASVAQSNEAGRVDFNFATPNGNATVKVETKEVEAGEQSLDPSGIVYLSPAIANQSDVVTENHESLVPLKKEKNETLGFFTKAGFLKHLKTYQKAYVTTVSVLLTGTSIVVGNIVAEGHFAMEKLASIPLVMAFAVVYRYFYNDVVTLFNYKSWTPKGFMESRKLAKEFLETGVRPAGLEDASGFEQLVKMYLLEVAFMGLTSIGGAKSDPASLNMAFILTSIAYTMTTTYDMIIARKRDQMIAKNPELATKYKLTANFSSMGAGFIDNVTMMDAKSGGIVGTMVLWTGAVVLNTYHFGWEKIQNLFGHRTPNLQCAQLF